MHAQLELTYSGSTGEVNHLTKKYNIAKSITLCLKGPRRFTGLQVVAMLRSKDEVDFEGKVKLKKAIC